MTYLKNSETDLILTIYQTNKQFSKLRTRKKNIAKNGAGYRKENQPKKTLSDIGNN